jgi:hypothetical protein
VVEDRIEESETAIEEGYSLYHVASKANPPISVSVRVNGVSLLMEVDTGAPFPQSAKQPSKSWGCRRVPIETIKQGTVDIYGQAFKSAWHYVYIQF